MHQSKLCGEKLPKNITGWESSQFYYICTSRNVNVESSIYIFIKHSPGNYDTYHWLYFAALVRPNLESSLKRKSEDR